MAAIQTWCYAPVGHGFGFAGSFTSVSTAGYADRDLCVAAAWEILAQPQTAFYHAGKL